MILIAFAGPLVWLLPKVYYAHRYRNAADRIQGKIDALRSQRPEDVSEQVWEATVGWGCIAFRNICATENHTPYEEMIRFERDLDLKLTEVVDLKTFHWLWMRLGETGPKGKDYVKRIKWCWDEWLTIDSQNRQLITP
jgi:hypothetical protein